MGRQLEVAQDAIRVADGDLDVIARLEAGAVIQVVTFLEGGADGLVGGKPSGGPKVVHAFHHGLVQEALAALPVFVRRQFNLQTDGRARHVLVGAAHLVQCGYLQQVAAAAQVDDGTQHRGVSDLALAQEPMFLRIASE